IGQRVEVFTSTLWLGMLLVARSVLPFVHIEYLSIAGGLVLTGLGLWWAERGAAALWDRVPVRTFVPLGAVVVAVIPASWDWATSGLENGLSVAWLGALMLVLARFPRRGDAPPSVRRAVATGVLVGLGPLVRPDLTIVSIVVGVALLWAARLRR